MEKEWYVISDFDGFVNSTRTLVFNNFGSQNDFISYDLKIDNLEQSEQEELDSVLSFTESSLIVKGFVKKQTNKKTHQVRHIISDEIFLDIIQSLNDRLVSNLLNNLVNKGLIDTGYDEESNDFVFWVKDENKKEDKKNTDPN